MYLNFARQCTDWRWEYNWEYNVKLISNTSNLQFLDVIIDTLCGGKLKNHSTLNVNVAIL